MSDIQEVKCFDFTVQMSSYRQKQVPIGENKFALRAYLVSLDLFLYISPMDCLYIILNRKWNAIKLEKKMYLNNFLVFPFSHFSSGTSERISPPQGHIQEFVQGERLKLFYLSGDGHPLGPENTLTSIDFTGPWGVEPP